MIRRFAINVLVAFPAVFPEVPLIWALYRDSRSKRHSSGKVNERAGIRTSHGG